MIAAVGDHGLRSLADIQPRQWALIAAAEMVEALRWLVMSVIVVGAGIAGVACARELVAAGVPVRVLERASTVGGRMASPSVEGRPVDLGAAYFTARDPEFAQLVVRWQEAGLARRWTDELVVLACGLPGGADGAARWSDRAGAERAARWHDRGSAAGPVRWATPAGLRSLVADLACGLDVEFEHEVCAVDAGPATRPTVDGEPADVVVLAMPDPQAHRLLPPGCPAAIATNSRAWRPVIAVAAGWSQWQWPQFPAAFVNDHPVLTLIADDGDRRGDQAPVLVAHTTERVARRHDADPAGAVRPVVAALRELLDVRPPPVWTHAHRWRFAAPLHSREPLFHLGDDGIGLAGDGWGSARVESAWRSGTLLARAVVGRLGGA